MTHRCLPLPSFLSVFLLALLLGTPLHAQPPFGGGPAGFEAPSLNTSVELLSDTKAVEAGKPFTLGVLYTMKDPWNIYWKHAGSSGYATSIDWKLPSGFEAGPVQWPIPKAKEVTSDGMTDMMFIYEKEVLLTATITPPERIDAKELTFSMESGWLECVETTCVPGDGKSKLTLPVGSAEASEHAEAFAATKEKIPGAADGWSFEAIQEKNTFALLVTPPADAKAIPSAEFFPASGMESDSFTTWNYADLGTWKKTDEGYVLLTDLKDAEKITNESITGILASPDGAKLWGGAPAIEVKAPLRQGNVSAIKSASITDGSTSGEKAAGAAQSDAPKSFFAAAILAFLGGLVLNLMPCIFPILGIKIMGFVKQAQDGGTHAWKHGLAFAFGVLVSFWVLVGTLLLIRAFVPGAEVFWGGQLKSPIFVAVMTFIFLLMTLNLFGVFELGTSLTGIGQDAQRKEGYIGSFMSGVLATLVATPCTAPFMGTAIAYAFSQPWYLCLAVFTFLALGMALPYVVLSSSPKLLKFIPKPGAWMDTFKKSMGFLMLAVTVLFVWILAGLLQDRDEHLLLYMLLVIATVGAWIYGKWGTPFKSVRTRWIARVVAAVLVLGAFFIQVYEPSRAVELEWENWSEQAVAEAIEAGRPVFVDFTATWCVSCQANKWNALKKEAVEKEFRNKNVLTLRADWTNQDKSITKGLAKLGRASIPVYPLYIPGENKPTLLPQLLTPSIVINALEALPDVEVQQNETTKAEVTSESEPSS